LGYLSSLMVITMLTTDNEFNDDNVQALCSHNSCIDLTLCRGFVWGYWTLRRRGILMTMVVIIIITIRMILIINYDTGNAKLGVGHSCAGFSLINHHPWSKVLVGSLNFSTFGPISCWYLSSEASGCVLWSNMIMEDRSKVAMHWEKLWKTTCIKSAFLVPSIWNVMNKSGY
jgi:hypothetical protein